MLEFIVLGQVPGTQVYLSFSDIAACLYLPALLYGAYLIFRNYSNLQQIMLPDDLALSDSSITAARNIAFEQLSLISVEPSATKKAARKRSSDKSRTSSQTTSTQLNLFDD